MTLITAVVPSRMAIRRCSLSRRAVSARRRIASIASTEWAVHSSRKTKTTMLEVAKSATPKWLL